MEKIVATKQNRLDDGIASQSVIGMKADFLPSEQLATGNRAAVVKQKSSALYYIFKRILDIVASFVGLIALTPVFLFIAFCIKLDDGGSILHFREVIGYRGIPANCHVSESTPISGSPLSQALPACGKSADVSTSLTLSAFNLICDISITIHLLLILLFL